MTESLSTACWEGDLIKVKELLSKLTIKQINGKNSRGQTAIYLAANRGHKSIVELLLSQVGIDVNCKENKNGSTPLHAASYYGHRDILVMLLVFGCDTTIASNLLLTARQEAIQEPVREVWQVFDASGVKGLIQKFPFAKKFRGTKSILEPNPVEDPSGSSPIPASVFLTLVKELDPQKLLKGHQISLGAKISEGNYTEVYLGTCDGKEVVIKKINNFKDKEKIEEFSKSIITLSKLDHPHVIALLGVALEPSYSIVYERAFCGDLYKYLHNSQQEHIFWNMKIKLAKDIAMGLAYIHEQQLIHINLKSQTVMLVSYSPEDPVVAKITDFSMSRPYSGVPEYMGHPAQSTDTVPHISIWTAPEVLSKRPWNQSIDVYSYGVILYEILTRNAFFGDVDFLEEVEDNVKNGNRPPIPNNFCPPLYNEILQSCWGTDNRPTIDSVIPKLEELSKMDLKTWEPDLEMQQQISKFLKWQHNGLDFIEAQPISALPNFKNSDKKKYFRSAMARRKYQLVAQNIKSVFLDSPNENSVTISATIQKGGYFGNPIIVHVPKNILIADLKISFREFSDLRENLDGIKLPSIHVYQEGVIDRLDVRKTIEACNISNGCKLFIHTVDE